MIDPILTNDSQRISHHLNNASEGQTIVINPGTYSITEDIEVTAKNELKILAHGAKFKQAGCNKPLHFKGCNGVTLEGLELQGEGGTLTSGTQTSFTGISGIYATDPTDFTVYKTKVKGFLGTTTKTIHIKKTGDGPIITPDVHEEDYSTPIAMKWTGSEPTFEIKGVYLFSHMKNLDDFIEAQRENWHCPAQNTLFADIYGNYRKLEIIRQDIIIFNHAWHRHLFKGIP